MGNRKSSWSPMKPTMSPKPSVIAESRTKKAISTASLIMFFVTERGSIRFSPSKESFYAEKVYVGDEARIDGVTYTRADMITIGYYFDLAMHKLLDKAKISNQNDIVVNNKVLDVKIPAGVRLGEDVNTKTRNKNREAGFSNFLAYTLVQKGYTLVTSLKKMKMSVKTIQFYLWGSVHIPFMEVFEVKDNVVMILEVMRSLKSFVSVCVPTFFGLNDLMRIFKSTYTKSMLSEGESPEEELPENKFKGSCK